jgi:hypothetical protein
MHIRYMQMIREHFLWIGASATLCLPKYRETHQRPSMINGDRNLSGREYLWFAVALIAVLLFSAAQVQVHTQASVHSAVQNDTAGMAIASSR